MLLLITFLSNFYFSNPDTPLRDWKCRNSEYLISQAKQFHDPQNIWNQVSFKIHVQEPRVGNPTRYSQVTLDNVQGEIQIDRFLPDGIVTTVKGHQGMASFKLRSNAVLSKDVVDQHQMNEARMKGRIDFYKIIYGLPMTITEDIVSHIHPAEHIVYNKKEAYKIKLELKEEIISQYWSLIISTDNHELLAVEFLDEDYSEHEGEILKMEGSIEVNGTKLPRMRHWHLRENDEYLGSDIIVEQLKLK